MSRDHSRDSEQEMSRDNSWDSHRLSLLLKGIGTEINSDSETEIEAETQAEKREVVNAHQLTEQLQKQYAPVDQVKVLQDIVQECNGTIYFVDLKTLTLKAGGNGNPASSAVSELLLRYHAKKSFSSDQLTESSAHYFLSEPLFLGQLPYFGRTRKKPNEIGEKNALLFNLMLTIHLGKADDFVVFSENGDDMIQVMCKPTAVICVFLLKAGDQFKFSSENKSTPTDFLINLYKQHFLIHYLSDETVAIMHFPRKDFLLRDVVKKAIINFNEEKKGCNTGFPGNPVILEQVGENRGEIREDNGKQRRVSKLFVEQNAICYLVGGDRAGTPKFTESYPLSTLIRCHFVVSQKIIHGGSMQGLSTKQSGQASRPPQATAHPHSFTRVIPFQTLNHWLLWQQPLSVRVGGMFQPPQPQAQEQLKDRHQQSTSGQSHHR